MAGLPLRRTVHESGAHPPGAARLVGGATPFALPVHRARLRPPPSGAVRSTRGVSRLAEFAGVPARLPGRWVEEICARDYAPGERVVVRDAIFAGLEGVYRMSDGDERAVVMPELLRRECRAKFAPETQRAAGALGVTAKQDAFLGKRRVCQRR